MILGKEEGKSSMIRKHVYFFKIIQPSSCYWGNIFVWVPHLYISELPRLYLSRFKINPWVNPMIQEIRD